MVVICHVSLFRGLPSGWTKRLEGYEPSYEVRGHELIQLTKEIYRNGIQDQYKMSDVYGDDD